MNHPEMRVDRARVARRGVGLLALIDALIGAWALLAPRSFYRDFPLPGAGWVSSEPPYNQHLLTDFGAALLGLAVALALAAVMNERRMTQAAVIAALVQAVPHLAFHLSHRGLLGAGQFVLSVISLAVPVVLATALLVLLSRVKRTELSR